MRTNLKPAAVHTHEGAKASHITPIEELRRAVLTCLLWEDNFYESGDSLAQRIKDLVPKCNPQDVAELAIEAREVHNLRHVPLYLTRELARASSRFSVASTLERVIQRADELAEFLAIYWKDGKVPLANQVKKGLARAFAKFDAYQLAKYNRDNAIKLRDVAFLVHAAPPRGTTMEDAHGADAVRRNNYTRGAVWRHKTLPLTQLVEGTLAAPDTWEVALSAGADKKETFTRLLQENSLGYLALLRNLRNMEQAGVDPALVNEKLLSHKGRDKILPFRFIAAARAAVNYEPVLDQAMQLAMAHMPRLAGRTLVLVDVSESMDNKLSVQSDLTRLDAASGVAVLIRGICDECAVATFSDNLVPAAPRSGMALIDAISVSQRHSGTELIAAVREVNSRVEYDRVIVITDEQANHDQRGMPAPKGRGYIVNVATNAKGVGYGQWVHVNGFSENVVKFIAAVESEAS